MNIEVNAHIEHRLARAEVLAAVGAGAARGADDDIGRAADLLQVLGAAMADGDAGVAAQQHHGDGLAHYQAAADDHHVLAGDGHLVVL